MMQEVGESLSGRIGLITLLGFSLRELSGIEYDLPFIHTDDYFAGREGQTAELPYDAVWEIVQKYN